MPHRPARDPRRQLIAARPIPFDGGLNLLDPAQVRANEHVAGRNWFRGEDMVIRPRPGNLPWDPATIAPAVIPPPTPVFSPNGVLSFFSAGSPPTKWTSDAGSTWTVVGGLGGEADVWWESGSTVWGARVGAKVFKSTDSGKNFAAVGVNVHATRTARGITVVKSTGRLVVMLSSVINVEPLAIAYSDDQAASWTTVILDAAVLAEARAYSLWAVSGTILMLIGRYGDGTNREELFRSTDGGATWAKVGPMIAAPPSSAFMDFLWVDPLTGYIFASMTRQGGVSQADLLRSTDLGATWQVVRPNIGKTGDINFPMRSQMARWSDGRLIWIVAGGGLQSSDNGASWADYAEAPASLFGGCYRMAGALIASRDDGIINDGWRTTDAITWVAMPAIKGNFVGFASPITGGA